MLMDEVVAAYRGDKNLPWISKKLSSVPRFIMSQRASSLAYELMKQPQFKILKETESLFAPARQFWIEGNHPSFFGNVGGLFLLEDEQTLDGTHFYFVNPEPASPAPMCVGLKIAQGQSQFRAKGASIYSPGSRIDMTEDLWEDGNACVSHLIYFLSYSIAVINTKRACRFENVTHEKHNAARARRGKFPLLSYSEVKINVDREDCAPNKTGDGVFGKALHHVRAHIRTRLGKTEFVRSHWRGDANLGVKLPHYSVVRDGERA